MAKEVVLQSRRHDTLSNWNANNPELLPGEIATVTISEEELANNPGLPIKKAPATLIKVGEADSEGRPQTFKELPWSSAQASDVPDNVKQSVVPINDIYKVFKSYWNAKYDTGYKHSETGDPILIDDPLIYSSIQNNPGKKLTIEVENDYVSTSIADTAKIVTTAGRRNGMWFDSEEVDGVVQPKAERIPMFAFTTDEDKTVYSVEKSGQPINCSTLAGLVTLGIPYEESRYNRSDLDSYDISAMSNIENSFNLFGKNAVIDYSNYKRYFITERQLARYQELGLEKESLHMSWVPKETADDTTSWYDCITPVSDLRNAQPGDLVFWNNDGEKKSDPRAVSHVTLVLDRLSYDSSNPDQPLLLLAEATSGSSLGIQTCYYMYDTRNLPKRDEEGILIAKTDEDDNIIYQKDANGDYIDAKDVDGNLIYEYAEDSTLVTVKLPVPESATGTNEHKIPKFICRPKYQRLTEESYQDITPKSSEEYKIISSFMGNGIAYTRITCDGSDRRLITMEFDWKPKDAVIEWESETIDDVTTYKVKKRDGGKGHYLSIWHGGYGEVLRHYVPNVSSDITYRVKVVIPLGAYVSTSKVNEINSRQLGNFILIREAVSSTSDPGDQTYQYQANTVYYAPGDGETKRLHNGPGETSATDKALNISNVVIYEGIKLAEYTDC
jgi:hypothetical protein